VATFGGIGIAATRKPDRSISRSVSKVKMIKTLDKFPFFSPTGNGRIACLSFPKLISPEENIDAGIP